MPGLNRSISRLSGSGVKRDGGIKLLDINEQPKGRDAKRRKKGINEEDAKQKDNEKAEQEVSTPDYAAGLTSMVPPSPAPPSYAPPATPAPQVVISEPIQPTQSQRIIVNISDGLPIKNENITKIEVSPQANNINQQQPQPQPQPQLQLQLQSQPQPIHQVHILRPSIQPQQQQQQTPQQQQQTIQPSQQPMIKRHLQLSREQMLEAQEMFKNSNTVTRPEKALILGFMAGSRENPCPQLGNIVTIKLNEEKTQMQQEDGTIQYVFVETHFQMNYNTGEWKKVQKLRKIDQPITVNTIQQIQAFNQHPQQTV